MKKNPAQNVSWGAILGAFLLCLLLGTAGFGYVGRKNQILRLGQEIKQAEIRLEDLRRLHQMLDRSLAMLCSPADLDARARGLNLGLVTPEPHQIVRLWDGRPAGPDRSLLARRDLVETGGRP